MPCTDDVTEAINTRDAPQDRITPATTTTQQQQQHQHWQTQTQTQAQPTEIDSALISAMRDNRERLNLLKLERTLIDFMRDNSNNNGNNLSQQQQHMELGCQTSFHRLVLHRLADRFDIIREAATEVGRYRFMCIFCIPYMFFFQHFFLEPKNEDGSNTRQAAAGGCPFRMSCLRNGTALFIFVRSSSFIHHYRRSHFSLFV